MRNFGGALGAHEKSRNRTWDEQTDRGLGQVLPRYPTCKLLTENKRGNNLTPAQKKGRKPTTWR
jgi:hypothetical protein